MKIKLIPLVLTVALVGTLPGFCEKKSPGAKRTAKSAKEAAAQRVDPSFVLARKAFDAGKLEDSAANIQAGAGKMRALVEGDKEPAASDVVTSAKDLDKLAHSVAQGKVKDGASLNSSFAEAHQAMARYQHEKAAGFVEAKKNLLAGQAMNRTADHAELVAKWSGEKLNNSQKGVIGSLRGVAGGLIGGAGTVVEGTGSVLKSGLGLITGLGGLIKGEKKASSGNLGKDAVDGTRKVSGGVVEGVGKVAESGAGAVEKTGSGLKKVGDKVSGKDKE